MYLVNFDPETGRVLSAGQVADEVIPEVLPEATVVVDKLPEGRAADYSYTHGAFTKTKEDDPV